MDDLGTLVRAAQNGDKEAFEQIVRRFQDMAYAVSYAMLGEPNLAQDAAQDAFLDAYLCLPGLREPDAFPGWFRRILIKHSDRQIRKERTVPIPLDDALSIPSALISPEEQIESHEMQTVLQDAVTSLSPSQRIVTSLFYLDGYSQKEIQAFLEMPISSVKKHLFLARKRLKENLMSTAKQEFNAHRPSQDDAFTTKVNFFIALKTHDLHQVKTLIARKPELLHARTEWGFGKEGDYWPVGYTPLHWAAETGDQVLLTYLLSQKADVEAETPNICLTPLHVAALMGQVASLHSLLDASANPGATTKQGHSALHLAAMRDYDEVVGLLLEYGADVQAPDAGGRTPLDWARETLSWNVARLLDASISIVEPAYVEASPNLDFGLKMTNLLAPIKWGGQVGLFTPLVGVGKAVILSHFIHEFVTRYRGQVALVGIEDENHPAEDLRLGWREWGVEGKIKLIFEQTDDFLGLAKKAGKTAETCLGRGTQVLLLVDGDRLPLVEAIQTSLSLPGDEKLTSLYYGSYSMGALPESLCTLDAVITFDGARAKQGLWPAIDPLRSTAKTESFTKAHAELADRARRLLARYQDLHDMVETLGLDGLKKPADRIDAERARKLHRYFTQPLPRAEPWTGVPGQIVSLDDTLADCAAILDGKYDDIPEDEFRFIGRINR